MIGVEPIRYRYHWILSPARLPIPSHRQMSHFRGTLVLYHSQKIKSRAFEKKIKIYFIVSYNEEQRSILRERLRAQGASPKRKRSTTVLLLSYHIYGNPTAGVAASAESAEPHVSKLPSAFVRFSNPNSRQSKRKLIVWWFCASGFAREAHHQKERG